MPASLTLPSIDNNICAKWTQDDLDYYNKLPYYFVKAAGAHHKRWDTWAKLLDTIPWTPNAADTLRAVGIEPTPVLRQMAFPNRINSTPKVDIAHVKERTTDAVLFDHQFVTPHFNFLPAFQDFLGSKVAPYRADLSKMITVFTETFYRTHMFHYSPYIYVSGVGGMDAPSGAGNSSGTGGKTNAFLASEVLNKDIQPLTFKSLYSALQYFENVVGATPYSGDQMAPEISQAVNDKFLLVGQSEVWQNFIDDPWVKENRPLNLNILTQGFYGDIFGQIRFRHEKYGLRIAVDDSYSPSYPAPETIETNSSHPEYGRTRPNPQYAKVGADGCPIGVAWLVGGSSYKIIEVGPPPAEFANSDVNGLIGMNWNGKIQMTKNFLVPCLDSDGNVQMETNSWGKYLRLQAEAVMGIVGYNKFNVMPIFYQRKNTISTIS